MNSSGLAVTMHMLRDAPGVIGSLLWAQDASLVAADLVPTRSEAIMQAVATRLQRLVEAHASVGALMEGLTLHYETCCIHICGVSNASLAVLLRSPSHLPALKLTLRHVLRELCRAPEVAALAAVVPASVPAVPVPTSHVDPGRTGRLYRGRSVE